MRRLLAVTFLVLAAVACDAGEGSWVGPHDAAGPGPRLALIGDSLVDCCDEAYVETPLPQAHPFALWSIGSTKLGGSANPWLVKLSPRPDVVIVAMGTNNAKDGVWGADDDAAIVATIAAIPEATCVVLVNLGHAPTATAAYQAGAAAGNLAYAATVDADPNRLRLADWRSLSKGAPAWFTADGIHHEPACTTAYFDLITATAGTCGAFQ